MTVAWLAPPPTLPRPEATAHLWRIDLAQPAGVLTQLRQHLSGDEMARAKRFHFDRDRRKFIAARGALRAILSRYLAQPPTALRFSYSAHGKPALADQPAPLAFNLSHSGELALLAVSLGPTIGVDVEQVRSMPDAEQIAERFFSARENAVFQTIPAAQRDDAFFNCWTRKEAYIKALGEGLSHPLDSFDVSLRPGEPAALLAIRGAATTADWSLHAFSPAPTYLAAVVMPGRVTQLAFWQWVP